MSALRINLLPAYIAEVRNTKVAIGVGSALFVGALALTLAYYGIRTKETTDKEAEASAMTQEATNATTALSTEKGKATDLRSKIAPIRERVTFVNNIRFYNTWVQKIYRRAARYTNRDIEYSAMAVNGPAGTLTMTGYTPSVDALSRYLITFYGNPDVTAVSISAPPGWTRPSQSQQSTNPLDPQNATVGRSGFPFTVNATLVRALQPPQLPASLNGARRTVCGTGAVPGGAPVGMPQMGGAAGPSSGEMQGLPPGQP